MVRSLEKFFIKLREKSRNNLKNSTYSLVEFLGDRMKIGVILREVGNRYTLNKEIEEVISYYGGVTIGIAQYNEEILEELDGMILQGGENYTDTDMNILTYLYKRDIPTLGICLGMQTMGMLFHGKMSKVENHYELEKQEVHPVYVDKESKFYSKVRLEEFYVNSRHHEILTRTSLDIVGVSSDGVMEILEDKKKKFFIGVQWHPETNFQKDKTSQKLFQSFFETIKGT